MMSKIRWAGHEGLIGLIILDKMYECPSMVCLCQDQSAHPSCLNVYLKKKELRNNETISSNHLFMAANPSSTAAYSSANICCTHSAAELLSFSI